MYLRMSSYRQGLTEILALRLPRQCCSVLPPVLCISHSPASFYLSHLVILFFLITYCYLESSVFLTVFCLFHRNHLLLHHIEIPHDTLKHSLSFYKILSEEFPLIHSQMRKTPSGPMWLTETVCVFLTTSFLEVRGLTL